MFKTLTKTASGSRTNTTIPAPTDPVIADGDHLLIGLLIGNSGEAPDPDSEPAGFTPVDGYTPLDLTTSGFNGELYLYEKIAASETGDYTIVHAGATTQAFLLVSDGLVSLDTIADVAQADGTGSAVTNPGVDAAANDSEAVFIEFSYGGPGSGAPSGMTQRLNEGAMHLSTATVGSGATGSRARTNGNSPGWYWGTVMLALTPAITNTSPDNDAAPSLAGTPRAGQAVAYSAGEWSGSPDPLVTAKVQRSADGISDWADVTPIDPGEDYTLTLLDQDRYVRVLETATNDLGSADEPSNVVGPVQGQLGEGFGIGSLNGDAGTDFTLTLDEDVPAGATIAVLVGWGVAGGSQEIDSVTADGLDFAAAHTVTGHDAGRGADYGLALWIAHTPDGNTAGDEITIAFTGAVTGMMAAAAANLGVTPISPVDGTPNGQFRPWGSAAQAWTSGPVPTAHAVDWLIGGAYSINSDIVYTSDPTAPVDQELYDFQISETGGAHLVLQNANVAETGNPACAGVWSGVDFADLTILVALRAGTGAALPENTTPPQITGYTDRDGGDDNCEVGDTLTCDTGEWSGGAPMSFEFQWLVGGSQIPIPGETHATYEVDPVQTAVGRQVTCRVTAINLEDVARARAEQALLVLDPDASDVLMSLNGNWIGTTELASINEAWQ